MNHCNDGNVENDGGGEYCLSRRHYDAQHHRSASNVVQGQEQEQRTQQQQQQQSLSFLTTVMTAATVASILACLCYCGGNGDHDVCHRQQRLVLLLWFFWHGYIQILSSSSLKSSSFSCFLCHVCTSSSTRTTLTAAASTTTRTRRRRKSALQSSSSSLLLLLSLLSLSVVVVARAPQQETTTGNLLWSDEFDGDTLDASIWQHDLGNGGDGDGWGNGQLQSYETENVLVQNGKLTLEARREQQQGGGGGTTTFTSGRIHSRGLMVQYGRLEARMKLPMGMALTDASGLWPAFWMVGASSYNNDKPAWPASGMIRVAHAGSGRSREQGYALSERIGSSVYWQGDNGDEVLSDFDEISTKPLDLTDDFLSYALEWTPDSITTYVEDKVILQLNIKSCAMTTCTELHEPFVLIFNLAVGGGYTGILDPNLISSSSEVFPAQLEIDYIRVYDNGYTIVNTTNAADDAENGDQLVPSASPSSSSSSEDETSTQSPTMASTGDAAQPDVIVPIATTTQSPSTATADEGTTMPSSTSSPSPVVLSPTGALDVAPVSTPTLELVASVMPSSVNDALDDLSSMAPSIGDDDDLESEAPTISSSSSPSSSPSSASPTTVAPTITLPFVQRMNALDNVMKVTNVAPLDSLRTLKWQQVTKQHLLAELAQTAASTEGMGQVQQVSVTLTTQSPPFVASRQGLLDGEKPVDKNSVVAAQQHQRLQDHNRRNLQTEQEITFDAVVTMFSAMNMNDVNENAFVSQAFANDAQIDAYLQALKASDDAFGNADNVTMGSTQGGNDTDSGGSPSQLQDGGNAAEASSGIDTSGIPFIVGVSVAGAAFVGLLGLLIVSRRNRAKRRGAHARGTNGSAVHNGQGAAAQETYPFEACKEADEDSLYDFTLHVPKRSEGRDGMSIMTSESSVTIEYDDQVAFQKESMYASSAELGRAVPPPSANKAAGVSESYMRRPSAQFYRFTVEAPSGLLGMVLERSVDGTPSIYGIKSTSPLSQQVRVGDLLVSVDGVDVSAMDCTAVSRLIASKKQNKFRQFVFVRPHSDDDDDDPDE